MANEPTTTNYEHLKGETREEMACTIAVLMAYARLDESEREDFNAFVLIRDAYKNWLLKWLDRKTEG